MPPFRANTQAFYEDVVRGFIARGKGNAKEPLYTQVAVIPSPAGGLDGRFSGGSGSDGGSGSGGGSGGDGGGGDSWSSINANNDNAGGFPMNGDECRPDTGDGGGEQARRYSPHGVEAGRGNTPGTVVGSCAAGGSVGSEGAGALGSSWPPPGADGVSDGGRSALETGAGAAQEAGESIVGLITCQVNGG